MKILVTGATGYLGSHLVRALLKDSHEVIILKRSFSNTRRIDEKIFKLKIYDIDKCGIELPFQENKKIDAIIHTAASYGRRNENVSEIFQANTVFPLKLLETANTFRAGGFFNTGTPLPRELDGYALSKAQFAEWGKQFADAKKIKFINVKPEHFYGPGDDDIKFTTYVIKNCMSNVPELKLTLGDQKRDFIYIDDAVSAYLVLIKKAIENLECFQEYEVGSGQAISIREFVETVHRLTKSQTKLYFGALPYRPNEVMHSEADISVLKTLGWMPQISLTEGIKRVIKEKIYS